MRLSIYILVLSLAAMSMGGCVEIHVTKLKANEVGRAVGFVYSLPKPFLQITPNADGTLTVTPVFLPDRNNTFSVTTKSFLSAYTLNLSRQSGLLTQVSFNGDATAAATAAVGAGSAIGTAVLQGQSAAGGSGANKGSGGAGQGTGAQGSGGQGAGASPGASVSGPNGGPAGPQPGNPQGLNPITPSPSPAPVAGGTPVAVTPPSSQQSPTQGNPILAPNVTAILNVPKLTRSPTYATTQRSDFPSTTLFAIDETDDGHGNFTLSLKAALSGLPKPNQGAPNQAAWSSYQAFLVPSPATLYPQGVIAFYQDPNTSNKGYYAIISTSQTITSATIKADKQLKKEFGDYMASLNTGLIKQDEIDAFESRYLCTLSDSGHIRVTLPPNIKPGFYTATITYEYFDGANIYAPVLLNQNADIVLQILIR